MAIFQTHPRLSLLALLMPVPMILCADSEGFIGQIAFVGSFFIVMGPMLVVRAQRKLSISEFMILVFMMMGSWALLVIGRAIVFGFLGKEL